MSQSHRIIVLQRGCHSCFLMGGGLKRETHMPKLRIVHSRNIEKYACTASPAQGQSKGLLPTFARDR